MYVVGVGGVTSLSDVLIADDFMGILGWHVRPVAPRFRLDGGGGMLVAAWALLSDSVSSCSLGSAEAAAMRDLGTRLREPSPGGWFDVSFELS